ncbi:MAG: hypothetical protein AABX32_03510 [Nanoarchaeota archaeon]
MILVFLDLVLFSNFYLRLAGYSGLSYAIISIFLSALIYLGKISYKLYWFLPTTLMFFVFLLIYLDIKKIGVIKESPKRKKPNLFLSYTAVLIKFLIFITSISAFIFISTISVHELGHAYLAQYYGCNQFKAVIYDIIAPHTEIRCDVYYNNTALTLAGLAATIAVALIFMLTGSQFTKGVAYLLFGFGFLVSYGDLIDLGISKNLITTTILMGLVITILAVVNTSNYYLKEQEIFKNGLNNGFKLLAEGHPHVSKILTYEPKSAK